MADSPSRRDAAGSDLVGREGALRLRVERELDLLERRFGRPRLGRRYRPLDELILTILSQNTNDLNRDRAYASLRAAFPKWESVASARRDRVEAAIRIGGLARTKSRVIQDVLRTIQEERGDLNLDFLMRVPAAEARQFLSRFKGVGEKTICCVLLFSCRHAAFPVDTHIHRVSRRLGWVPRTATPARTHAELGRLIPKLRYLTAHVNLITLGRRLCRAGRPDCPACPLRRACRHAARAGNGVRRPARTGARGLAVR